MATRAPQTIHFAISGPIARADLPGLCQRVCALLERSGAELALCDVSGVDPDAVTVDALARLQLAARRHGCQVRLRGASSELLELLALMGLRDVLPDRSTPGSSRLGQSAGLSDDRAAGQVQTVPLIAPATTDEFSNLAGSYRVNPLPHQGGTMARMIFVNLAVDDLDKSVEFFTQLGFTFDPQFTDEHATCMIVSDQAFVMLLVKSRFKDFTKKELVDPTTHTEAILALSAESREQVDELADKALQAGGTPANDPIEMDFMYGRSFQDLDGHLWELMWMDPKALAQ